MYRQKLEQIVKAAISMFNIKHLYLLENDLSERCICSAFARCLELCLPVGSDYKDLFIDVEYNRGNVTNNRAIKILQDKKIVVDIIVHKRGFKKGEFSNLICIEMKKSTNRDGCEADERRLACMTNSAYGYNYCLGCMIIADMKKKKLILKTAFPKKAIEPSNLD